MISIFRTEKKSVKGDGVYITTEFRGLSTDTKPITYTDENANEFKVDNGSVYICIDTQDVYIYDGENTTWLPNDGNNSKNLSSNINLNKEIITEPIIETKEEIENKKEEITEEIKDEIIEEETTEEK